MAERDKGQEQLLNISEIANLLGMAPSALRYYERKGLIAPQRSRWSNYRGYGPVELFELTDIIRYRNAGVPVKDLDHLFHSPIAETLEMLDAEIDRKLDELEDLRLSLSAATHLSQKIRRRMTIGAVGRRENCEPPFEQLIRFEQFDREFLSDYLRRRDEIVYGALFCDPSEPHAYFDCICSDGSEPGEVVWSRKKGARYIEFLLTSDYAETGKNDLGTWQETFASEGIRIGTVVAEYLTYDVDPETGERFDCYDAWAEVL